MDPIFAKHLGKSFHLSRWLVLDHTTDAHSPAPVGPLGWCQQHNLFTRADDFQVFSPPIIIIFKRERNWWNWWPPFMCCGYVYRTLTHLKERGKTSAGEPNIEIFPDPPSPLFFSFPKLFLLQHHPFAIGSSFLLEYAFWSTGNSLATAVTSDHYLPSQRAKRGVEVLFAKHLSHFAQV